MAFGSLLFCVLSLNAKAPLIASDLTPQIRPIESRQANQRLNNIRIPIEFNAVPGTQWAPRTVDPAATKTRNFYSLKIKPFIPIKLNNDWHILSYTVLNFRSLPWGNPVLSFNPAGTPFIKGWTASSRTGLSSISPTFALSPNTGPDLVVGFGPSLSAPVGTYPLSTEQWSVGPAFFAAYQQGRWLIRARVHNMWSFSGNQDLVDTNILILRPRVQYALDKHWFLVSSPLITNDWTKPRGKGLMLPIGGGFGRNFRMGSTRVNASIQAYYNAIRPTIMHEDLLGEWNVRTEINFILPK